EVQEIALGVRETNTPCFASNCTRRNIHDSYTDEQRDWLLDIRDFVALVKERQNRSEIIMR
ncbi:hypothetical protein, partial [Burkholderia ubonensis]|uniref:hypothetical protein n=1 Tax=Burkholderia ubonensis TaxID=101571 RepID=UPI001E2E8297